MKIMLGDVVVYRWMGENSEYQWPRIIILDAISESAWHGLHSIDMCRPGQDKRRYDFREIFMEQIYHSMVKIRLEYINANERRISLRNSPRIKSINAE